MAERDNDFVPVVPLGNSGGEPSIESYEIDGLRLEAAYDGSHRLLFVLDRTKDAILPNVVLVIAGRDGRKWDDVLENDFGISPETVRPRVNNKYQKLDIDYEGLDHYADAIRTKDAAALYKWRLLSAERQKELRMIDASHEIELARATIAEAEKTIDELDELIHAQKNKLRAAKKAIGTEPPKDSAAKILRFEARIERATLKKARSMRRLKRAQKRIDSATDLLNNYKKTLIPRGIEMSENDVQPLFTENPDIMDNENAFKPVSFARPPQAPAEIPSVQSNVPGPFPEASTIPQPMPQFAPPPMAEPVMPPPPPQYAPPPQPAYMSPPIMPASPAPMPIERPVNPAGGFDVKISATPASERASGAYYMLLLLLIGLSIFTLYLYQKKMNSADIPHIAAAQTDIVEPEPLAEPEPIVEPEPIPDVLPEPVVEIIEAEPVVFEEPDLEAESPIMDAEPVEVIEIIEEPPFEPEPEPVFEEAEEAVVDESVEPSDEPEIEPDDNGGDEILENIDGDAALEEDAYPEGVEE